MDGDITGTPPLVRIVNRHRILDRIRREGEVSRAELAKLTGIRPPTVSAVIRQLIGEGLVEDVGNGETLTGTGRPPRMVALSRTPPRAVGFEVSGRAIRTGLCDLGGGVTSSQRIEHSPDRPERTVNRLGDIGDELLGHLGLTWSDMRGVGVAVPGLVDSPRGIVRWSRPFGWRDTPLQQICEARWGTRTDILNNSVAGSLAEHYLGAGRQAKSLVYIYIRFHVVEPHADRGARRFVRLGSGIIIDGEPYHGEFGAAGEVTTPVDHPCAGVRDQEGQLFADTETFVAALQKGQRSAVQATERLAADIGVHVLHAINFLDPGVVVIESDEPVLRDAILVRLRRIVAEDRLRQEAGRTTVTASALGEFGMARGAVVPTLQRIFRIPRLM